MSDPSLNSFLEKHNFGQGDKPLRFLLETAHGPLELLFQPLKRTKYAGEIRYREFVGCRVTLTVGLHVPSRFIVTDKEITKNPMVAFMHKRRKFNPLDCLGHNLIAQVASKEWSESILCQEEVKKVLPTLFHTESKIRRQQSLILDPLNLTYAYRMKRVDLEILDGLIPAFLLVCDKVKQAEEPKEKLSLTSTENFFIEHPYLVAVLILVGVMALFLVPFILIGWILFMSK